MKCSYKPQCRYEMSNKINNNSLTLSKPQSNKISPSSTIKLHQLTNKCLFLELGLFKSGFKFYQHLQIIGKNKRIHCMTNSC